MADNGTDQKTKTETEAGWMSDVQRAIALILIGTFAMLCVISTFVVVWTLDRIGLADMAKTMQAALVNMALIALGFFFGNTMAKMAQDRRSADVVEKLTGQPPAGGPVQPLPPPVVVVSWWSLMEPDEKAAIAARAETDSKIKAVHEALISGKAEPPDIVALIDAGLLKPDRKAQFKTV